jgi:hypothetical protein
MVAWTGPTSYSTGFTATRPGPSAASSGSWVRTASTFCGSHPGPDRRRCRLVAGRLADRVQLVPSVSAGPRRRVLVGPLHGEDISTIRPTGRDCHGSPRMSTRRRHDGRRTVRSCSPDWRGCGRNQDDRRPVAHGAGRLGPACCDRPQRLLLVVRRPASRALALTGPDRNARSSASASPIELASWYRSRRPRGTRGASTRWSGSPVVVGEAAHPPRHRYRHGGGHGPGVVQVAR